MSLVGRLAYITGAGSGLGKATCQSLAREGAVIIAADKNLQSAEETVKSLVKNQENHLALYTSVEDSNSVKTALKTVLHTFSRPPTIIVNSAGITKDNFLLKLSESDFDAVLNVNLKGTFLVIQTFANAIVEHQIKNASIINLGSIVAKFGNIGQVNYSASKAGVELMTKVASREFGKFGIRVNTVLPGMIKTPMFNAVPDKVKDKFIGMIPLGRFGESSEIAEVITFLASDKSSYVNGASIEVTGGI